MPPLLYPEKDWANPGSQHKNQWPPNLNNRGDSMKKSTIIAILMSLACTTQGMDEAELARHIGVDSVQITPSNLVIKLSTIHRASVMGDDGQRVSLVPWDLDKTGWLMTLTPGRWAVIGTGHVGVNFTPVVFKNQMNGFMLTERHRPPPPVSSIWRIPISRTSP